MNTTNIAETSSHNWKAEYTDTYGGDANYSWVERTTFAAKNERDAVIQAKKAFGLTGIRCRRENWGGNTIALYPSGMCRVVFVTWRD